MVEEALATPANRRRQFHCDVYQVYNAANRLFQAIAAASSRKLLKLLGHKQDEPAPPSSVKRLNQLPELVELARTLSQQQELLVDFAAAYADRPDDVPALKGQSSYQAAALDTATEYLTKLLGTPGLTEALPAECDAAQNLLLALLAVNRSYGDCPFTEAVRVELEHEAARALKLFAAESNAALNPGKKTAKPSKRNHSATSKGQKEPSAKQLKMIAVLTTHHKYENGECHCSQPIALRKLHTEARVGVATASAFFKKNFGSYTNYEAACLNDFSRVTKVLKTLNGENTPFNLDSVAYKIAAEVQVEARP